MPANMSDRLTRLMSDVDKVLRDLDEKVSDLSDIDSRARGAAYGDSGNTDEIKAADLRDSWDRFAAAVAATLTNDRAEPHPSVPANRQNNTNYRAFRHPDSQSTELRDANRRLESLEDDNYDLRRELRNAVTNGAGSPRLQQKIDELRDDQRDRNREITLLHQEKAELSEQLDSLMKDKEDAKTVREDLKREKSILQVEKADLAKLIRDLMEVNQDLQVQVDEHGAKPVSGQGRVDSVTEREDLKKEVSRLQIEKTDLVKLIQDLVETNQNLRLQVDQSGRAAAAEHKCHLCANQIDHVGAGKTVRFRH